MAHITEELIKSFKTGGLYVKDITRYGTYQDTDNAMEKTYEKISIDLYDLPQFVVVCFCVDYPNLGPSDIDQYVFCPINVHPQEYLNSINVDKTIPIKYKYHCDLYTHFVNHSKHWYDVTKVLYYDFVTSNLFVKPDCFHFQCIDIIMCNYNTRKRYEELSTLYDDLYTTEDVEEKKIKTKISISFAHVLIIIGILGLIISPTAADNIGTILLCTISSAMIGIGIADITID